VLEFPVIKIGTIELI